MVGAGMSKEQLIDEIMLFGKHEVEVLQTMEDFELRVVLMILQNPERCAEVLQPKWVQRYLEDQDEEGYVPFNADRRLGQNQYASRKLDGRHGSPNLGEGLRIKMGRDYHDHRIHRDDLVEFHDRFMAARAASNGGIL